MSQGPPLFAGIVCDCDLNSPALPRQEWQVDKHEQFLVPDRELESQDAHRRQRLGRLPPPPRGTPKTAPKHAEMGPPWFTLARA